MAITREGRRDPRMPKECRGQKIKGHAGAAAYIGQTASVDREKETAQKQSDGKARKISQSAHFGADAHGRGGKGKPRHNKNKRQDPLPGSYGNRFKGIIGILMRCCRCRALCRSFRIAGVCGHLACPPAITLWLQEGFPPEKILPKTLPPEQDNPGSPYHNPEPKLSA